MPKKKNSTKSSGIKKSVKKTSKNYIARKLKLFIKNFPKLSFRTKGLFIFGILFLGISLLWNLNQTIQLAFFTPKVTPVEKSQAIPIVFIIEKFNVNLPIEETAINNGIWQVSQNVSHLTTSARPGENGSIILYGHNTTEKLGPIRWLSKGDFIEIKTADGKNHTYKVDETIVVAPNQMDIFTQRKKETLIIYTCDGFADLQRFIVVATVKN